MAIRTLRRTLLVLPMLILAACNAVGEGNKLVSIKIKDSTTYRDLVQPVSMARCLRYNLAANGTFTDGSSADYGQRATWTSSNTSVARVSNGDIILPSTATTATPLAYSRGTVIPVGIGQAVITVNYVGVTDNITINVNSTASISIVPSTTAIPRPASSSPITIAPRTVQAYAALATINGRVTDVTSAGYWTVQNAQALDPNTNTNTSNTTKDAVEKVAGSTSSFRAKPLNDTNNPVTNQGVVIQADFNSVAGACPTTPTSMLNVANFDPANPITLTSSFDTTKTANGSSSAPTAIDPLIVGTTDRLYALAHLKDGSGSPFTQDMSELLVSGDDTTTAARFSLPAVPSTAGGAAPVPSDLTLFTYTTAGNLIVALSSPQTTSINNAADDSNSRTFYAKFITVPGSGTALADGTLPGEVNVKSNNLQRQTRNATLTDITISAPATTINVPYSPQYGEDAAKVQLKAVGTFVLADGVTTATQDLTREVTWPSSDSSIISVVNGSQSPAQAGLAFSKIAGVITVSASYARNNPTTSVVTTTPSNTLTLIAQ